MLNRSIVATTFDSGHAVGHSYVFNHAFASRSILEV